MKVTVTSKMSKSSGLNGHRSAYAFNVDTFNAHRIDWNTTGGGHYVVYYMEDGVETTRNYNPDENILQISTE